MNLRLHIDRIVLEGLTDQDVDGERLGRAVQAELTRLFGEGGIGAEFAQGGARHSMMAEAISHGSGDSLENLGERIGGAVYGVLGSPRPAGQGGDDA